MCGTRRVRPDASPGINSNCALLITFPPGVRLAGGGTYLAKGRFLDTAPNSPPTGDTRYGFLDLSFLF